MRYTISVAIEDDSGDTLVALDRSGTTDTASLAIVDMMRADALGACKDALMRLPDAMKNELDIAAQAHYAQPGGAAEIVAALRGAGIDMYDLARRK